MILKLLPVDPSSQDRLAPQASAVALTSEVDSGESPCSPLRSPTSSSRSCCACSSSTCNLKNIGSPVSGHVFKVQIKKLCWLVRSGHSFYCYMMPSVVSLSTLDVKVQSCPRSLPSGQNRSPKHRQTSRPMKDDVHFALQLQSY